MSTAIPVDHTWLHKVREPSIRIRALQNERLIKTTDFGITWIDNQASTYDDDMLLNPFAAF